MQRSCISEKTLWFQRLERLERRTVRSTYRHMNEIINLKRARKAKARSEAEAGAAANRIAHGRTKSEKQQTKAEADAVSRHLDAHKRDDNG